MWVLVGLSCYRSVERKLFEGVAGRHCFCDLFDKHTQIKFSRHAKTLERAIRQGDEFVLLGVASHLCPTKLVDLGVIEYVVEGVQECPAACDDGCDQSRLIGV